MSGDKVVLEEVLKQQKQERASSLSSDQFFEVFCADQILKDCILPETNESHRCKNHKSNVNLTTYN